MVKTAWHQTSCMAGVQELKVHGWAEGKSRRRELRASENGIDPGLADRQSLTPLFEHSLRGSSTWLFPSKSKVHGAAEENVRLRLEPCFLKNTETPETKSRVPGQVVLSVGLFSFNRTTKNQKRAVLIFPLKKQLY